MALSKAFRMAMGALVIGSGLAASGPALAGSVLQGTWRTESKSEITIAPCRETLCGYITKIVVPPEIARKNKDALAQIGTNYYDYYNKDPKLRNRPIQGLRILTLHPGKSAGIFDGQIYNPQDGNTYSGYVEVIDRDHIRLNGCVFYNMICKGEDWVRVLHPNPPPVIPPQRDQ